MVKLCTDKLVDSGSDNIHHYSVYSNLPVAEAISGGRILKGSSLQPLELLFE